MDTKQQLREALADLMAVDGLYDVPAIKERVMLARANVRRVFQRLDGAAHGQGGGHP